MSQKNFFLIIGVIFAVIALLHFLRMTFAWEAAIGQWVAPMWLSGIGFVVALYLSYESFRLRKKAENYHSQ